MPDLPLLTVRGSEGFKCLTETGHPSSVAIPFDNSSGQRASNHVFQWSADGKYLAFCNGEGLFVFDVAGDLAQPVFHVNKTRVISIHFSPRNSYISTFEPFGLANDNKNNIAIFCFKTQKLLTTFTQGHSEDWRPQFSSDEKLCCKMVGNSTAIFFEDGDFSKPANNLSIPSLKLVELSPDTNNTVAIYIGGTKKGTPSMVKVLRYPDLDQYTAISSKTFYKADKASLHWSHSGNGLLVKATTEVDNTGQTYYGESMLFLVTPGASSVIELNKKGPLYDMKWDPCSDDFVVVYGHMPSKASMFNIRGNMSFDFGTGLRTAAAFAPQGHLLAIYGHGSVRSNVEIWDRKAFQLIAKLDKFDDITYFDWSPCGERFVVATLSPTLKVDNKFAVYHYSGKQLFGDIPERMTGRKLELWQIGFQKFPASEYPAKKLEFTPISLQSVKVQEATEKKYVPPHLRKQQQKSEQQQQKVVLDINDLPQNERTAAAASGQGKAKGKSSEASVVFRGETTAEIEGDLEEEKRKRNRIKTLEKRLKEIRKLKVTRDEGGMLGKDTLQKIEREAEVLNELESLKIGSE